MKKFLFSIVAVLLIVVASAFVNSKHYSPKAVYHWYTVNSSGVVVSGSDAFGGATKDQAYANSNAPCPLGKTRDCIRGFLNVPPFPTSAIGEATPVKKP